MPAGHSQATLGMGQGPLWHCDSALPDSLRAGKSCNEDGSGVEKAVVGAVSQASFDYRLGILDSVGKLPGLELEWHVEAPTNPATMEFALNLGLPGGGDFHHKIGAGWGVGAWADNSFFVEYAVSRRVGFPVFFGNLRVTYLATQIGTVLGDDFSKALPSDRVLVTQAGAGLLLKLPRWRVAPDFLIPQLNVTVPQVPGGERAFRAQDIPTAQWNMSLGMGWTY